MRLDNANYDIGGITTNISRAYLNRSALQTDIQPNPNSFHYVGYEVRDPVAPYPYKPKRGAPGNIEWPPKGSHVLFRFQAPRHAPQSHKNVNVTVHYEMYIGVCRSYDRINAKSFKFPI